MEENINALDELNKGSKMGVDAISMIVEKTSNKKLKKVDTFEGETISKKEVKNAFVQKYQVNPTKVEIGYENDQFVYCLTYKGKDTLLYAFYSLDNGEFLKAYKL